MTIPPETAENHQASAKDITINDFLSEMTGAARELTNSIKGSVSKVMNTKPGVNTYPPLDVYETTDSVIVRTAPLDTVEAPRVEVSMLGDILTLKITTTGANEIAEDAYLLKERRFGEFIRTVQIPRAVKATDAQARLKNNVLTITLPKVQDAGPRIIDVQMAE